MLLQMHIIYLYLICCTWTAPVLSMFSGTILLLLLICNGVLVFFVLVFTFQIVVYVFSVSFLAHTVLVFLLYHILFCAALCVSNNNKLPKQFALLLYLVMCR